MDNSTIKDMTSKTIGASQALFGAHQIPAFVIGIILSTSALYVLIAVIVHRIRKNKAQQRNAKSTRPARPGKGTSSSRLDNLILAAASLAFLNCSSNHPVLFTSHTSDVVCKVLQLFAFMFYAVGIACLYTFLWMRQRTCYKNPTLAMTYNEPCKVVSACILPVFLIMMVAGAFMTGALWSFESSVDGCLETTGSRAPLVMLFAGAIVMQLTLELLFIFPIKRHAKRFFAKSSQRSTDKVLVSLVRRSVATTVLCILADLITFILANVLIDNVPFLVINFLYDTNLLCNVICVICSYSDWQSRLGLCCMKKEKSDAKDISSKYSSVKTSSTTVV